MDSWGSIFLSWVTLVYVWIKLLLIMKLGLPVFFLIICMIKDCWVVDVLFLVGKRRLFFFYLKKKYGLSVHCLEYLRKAYCWLCQHWKNNLLGKYWLSNIFISDFFQIRYIRLLSNSLSFTMAFWKRCTSCFMSAENWCRNLLWYVGNIFFSVHKGC